MCHKTGASIIAGVIVLACPALAPAGDLRVIPTLTLEERWDSNVTFTEDRERVEDDFVSTAAPRITVAKENKRFGLSAFYGLFANYHTGNSDLNYVAHSAGLDAAVDASKNTKLSAGDRFDYTKDSLQATSTGILVSRTDITANTAYIDLKRKFGKSSDAGISLSENTLMFKEPSLIDTRTDSAALSLGYGYDKEGRTALTYTYTNYHFDNPDSGKNIETHWVSLGVSERVSPTITLEAAGGVVYTPQLEEAFWTATGVILREYRDSSLKLAFQRNVTSPNGLTDEINITERVGFEWTQRIERPFGLTVFGGISKNKSEPSGAVDINSYDAGITGSWYKHRWVTVNAGVLHFQQWTGDNVGEGLKRNQVFVNLTFIGPEWRF